MKGDLEMAEKLIAISRRNEGTREIKIEDIDDYDVRLWDVKVIKKKSK
jgi:hypothetical protein